MFPGSSKPSQPVPTTFNERLNEQLMNCLNVQTSVIQNLAQYSQHISIQLFEIKSVVEILSNRVLALQQQQQQQSHFPSNPYAPSYYPNYMSHQTIPVSHPPPASHPPPVPHSVQQQPVQMRMPSMSTMAAGSNPPFFNPPAATNPPLSLPSNGPSFQFSTPKTVSASQTTMINTLPPTTTTPTKSFFSSAPKFTTTDTNTKPTPQSSLFTVPTTTTTIAFGTKNDKPANQTPFNFGVSNLAAGFGAGAFPSTSSTISAAKPETNADDDAGEGGGDDDSYEPNVSFKPIVQLSAVEIKTGEEDENVLFCERGKLYRFDAETNQMKERGIGEIKILQHKTTKVCRMLMRREQVLKICANHQITAQMELKPHPGSANAYVWSAMDFADGEAKHETLCIRFKTEEQAKNFAKVFNEVKGTNAGKTSDVPSIGKISLNDDTKTKTTTNDDDVISIGEIKPSAEQIDRAEKLQLPSTFYLYENKEPCKGCPGCKEDTPSAVLSENNTTTTTNIVKNDTKTSGPQPPSVASASKTPLSSSENKFSLVNSDKSQPQIQKQTSTTKDDKTSVESTSNATAQYDNKPSIFGSFNGNSSVFGNSTPASNSSSSVFGGVPTMKPANNGTGGFSFPGFGSTPASTTGGFQFSTPSAPATTTAADTNTTFSFGSAAASTSTANTTSTFSFGAPANQPLFGNTPKFTFSDLAKQSSSTGDGKPISNGGDQRVFAGQGALVFGTSSTNTTTTGNNHEDEDAGEGGGDDDSYEPNVSFKPIVQLSAVEVKTGEEDENVLFCERGKLYRFDAEANQMKERGIGEIKILQHKTTKVYRILMRREQVLKICANHQITAQMELKPHQGSENAYVWSAMDFADGEAKHETLCIRFKSGDIAKRFVKQFNDAKQTNADAQK